MAMSNERFNEILKQKFDFGRYLELDSDNNVNNIDPYTGQEVPEEIKKLVKSLKLVSMTKCGTELLENLDPNTKITVAYSKNERNEEGDIISPLGVSTANHEIVIYECGVDKGQYSLATTLMHELTHERQFQNDIRTVMCEDPHNGFMLDKLKEAEARLKTAEVAYELCSIGKNLVVKYGIYNEMGVQTKEDMINYLALKIRGLSKEEVNRKMLKKIYNDKWWNEDYNEQSLRVADVVAKYGFKNYDSSMILYRLEQREINNNIKDKEMFEKMMSLMKLNKEDDVQYFSDPKNISAFPASKFLETVLSHGKPNDETVIFSMDEYLESVSPKIIQNDVVDNNKTDEDGLITKDNICEDYAGDESLPPININENDRNIENLENDKKIDNILSIIRSNLANKVDDTIGTNLKEVKVPENIKKIESFVASKLEHSK